MLMKSKLFQALLLAALLVSCNDGANTGIIIKASEDHLNSQIGKIDASGKILFPNTVASD